MTLCKKGLFKGIFGGSTSEILLRKQQEMLSIFLEEFGGIRLVEFCETYMEKCCRNSLGFFCVVRLVKFVFPLSKCCPFCSKNFRVFRLMNLTTSEVFALKPRGNAVHFLEEF